MSDSIRIYPYMTDKGLIELVPMEQYNQLKKTCDEAIMKRRDYFLAAQNADAEAEQLRAELKASEQAFRSFRESITQALDEAGAPTHLPSVGAPALKPMTPHQRIAALDKLAEPPTVDGKTPEEAHSRMLQCVNACAGMTDPAAEIQAMLDALNLASIALCMSDDEVDPPDTNCSCHINPPCNDCVDHSQARETKEFIKSALAKLKPFLS